MKKIVIYIFTMVLLNGCALKERQPLKNQHLQQKYKYAVKTRHTNLKWHHRELNRLIRAALKNNPGLLQTRKRLEQAALTAKISFADLLPAANVSLARSTLRAPQRAPDQFSLTGAASYELDVWRKNISNYQQSLHLVKASQEDMHTSEITLIGSIAANWLTLLALREEEHLVKKQIATNNTILKLQQKRYAHGVARALDVLQQQETLAGSKAQLPPILAKQALTEHQLAILIGQTPNHPPQIKGRALPHLIPLPQHGLPMQLLKQRPDIKAAWQRVIAADYAFQVARRNRLPAINLSANLIANATQFNRLVDNWLLTLAASVTQSIFNGGELRARQQLQKAIAEEVLANYIETVLFAVKEVQDNLAQEYFYRKTTIAVKEQLRAAQAALQQAHLSYANGDSNYLDVLINLLKVQSLERQVLQTRRDRALNRIALYRSLGGPWPLTRRQSHVAL